MAIIRIHTRPDIVVAKAIFDNGEETTLTQKRLGSGALSQSLFFEKFEHRGYSIQLRLDWAKKSINKYGDPTLDADIYEANGAKHIDAQKEWHHTSKTQDGSSWIYEWKFQDLKFRFNLGTTSERTIGAVARIENPNTVT